MKASPNHPKVLAAAKLKMLEQEYNLAWGARDLPKCMEVLDQVLAINPRSANALLLRGRMHGVQYEYDEAIDWFEKAVAASPKNQQLAVTIEAGNMARDFFDPTIAESFYQIAVEHGANVPAKLALAEYSIRLRKLDVARTLVDEALKSAPMDPTAALLWCRLHEDRYDDCEARLERLLTVQSEELRAKAGYQLAKMRDAAGDYDGAMHALVAGKSALMQMRAPIVHNREKTRLKYLKMAEEFNATQRDAWREAASHYGEPHKLALVGGHPRSGTTLLEQVLDSHPGVISAEETENFNMFVLRPFMRDHPEAQGIMDAMDAGGPAEIKAARERYFASMEGCLEEAVGSRLLVDKNPSLTHLAPVLFRTFPEIQFVTMIRDPRDVILSCYMQSFVPVSAVNGTYLTLEDAAAEYVSVMSSWTAAAQHFDDNVCEVRYEEMVEDLEGHARKVLGFLGLDWSESVMDYDRHAREKVVRSPTANAVTEKVHSRAKNRWKNYEKYLEPVFKTLAPCLKSLGYE